MYSWRTERPSLQLPRHCNRPQLDHIFGPVRPGFKSVMNERTISPRARRPFNNLFKFLSLSTSFLLHHTNTQSAYFLLWVKVQNKNAYSFSRGLSPLHSLTHSLASLNSTFVHSLFHTLSLSLSCFKDIHKHLASYLHFLSTNSSHCFSPFQGLLHTLTTHLSLFLPFSFSLSICLS